MKTFLQRSISLFILIVAVGTIQLYGQNQQITQSGGFASFANATNATSISVTEVIAGNPTNPSSSKIVINGIDASNTSTILDTYTGNVTTTRHLNSLTKTYVSFQIQATWQGGNQVAVIVNVTPSGGGSGGQPPAYTITLGAPTGACQSNQQALDSSTGNFYTCGPLGTWIFVGPGSGNGVIITIVANLPVSPTTGTVASVTDGSSATDCTVGGGSTLVLCRFGGSSWGTYPAGSANAGGSNLQLQWNNSNALGGISGWTTNGTTTITGGASSILNLSAMTLTNIQFPSVSANFFFAGPNGSSNTPSFRAIVAADLPAALASSTSVNGTTIPGSATLMYLSAATQTLTNGLTIGGTLTTNITGGGIQCLHVSNTGVVSGTTTDCGSGGSGDTITSPNSTLAIGGTATNTTLDLVGAAGEIMAGTTPALTYTPVFGVDNSHAGSIQTANGSANAHTIWGSAATTSNTILGPATVPTTLHLFYCVVSSTTCTFTDTGYAYNSIPNADLANSAITIAGASVSLGGSTSTLPSPGAIGGTTPAAGTFTTLTANTSLVINGGTAQTGTQGTDTKLLTAGTVSGTGVSLCTDANGGATTAGCSSGAVSSVSNSDTSLTISPTTGAVVASINSSYIFPLSNLNNASASVGQLPCVSSGGTTLGWTAPSAGGFPYWNSSLGCVVNPNLNDSGTALTYVGSGGIIASKFTLTGTYYLSTLPIAGSGTPAAVGSGYSGIAVSGDSNFYITVNNAGYGQIAAIPGAGASSVTAIAADQILEGASLGVWKVTTLPAGIQNYTLGTGYNKATATQLETGRIATTTGSSNAYILTLSPAITSYTGFCGEFISNFANTTAATININGVGSTSITKAGASATALAANDIKSGQDVSICYDGTQMEMMSQIANATGGSGDTITSPNSTLTVGGSTSNTTLDLVGSAGEIMAGTTPALTYTPTLGKSGTAGTLSLFPSSGNFTSTIGSAATASNTINLFASVPTNLHTFYCAVSSTTCTFTDTGYAYNAIPFSDLSGNATIAQGGTNATSAAAGTIPNATSGTASTWTATPTLGASGTLGSLTFGNATSGLLTLQTATGAITSYTIDLPVVQPSGSNTFLSCTAANPAVCTWAAGGGGAPSLDAVTGAAAQATGTETAAGHNYTFAGVETSGLTSAFNITDANSTNNNTNVGLMGGVTGTSTGGIGALIYDVSGTGDILRLYSGGSVNNATYTQGTLEAHIDASGNATFAGSVIIGTPPACTFGSGGGFCWTEGTNITNASGTIAIDANSTSHEIAVATNGSTSFGQLVRAMPNPIATGPQTASITTATLCAASAGACNIAGQYHIHLNIWESGTACSAVTAGSVAPTITWTDENATAHSAVPFPMITNVSGTALATSFLPTVSADTAWASGDLTISTNGSVIQYAITYTACTTGTLTYNARATVTALQNP